MPQPAAAAALFLRLAAGSVLVALATLGGACAAAGHDVGGAIDRAWDAHLDAARRKDLAGVLAMYAEDAVTREGDAEPVHGRVAIEEVERRGLAQADVGEDVRHTRHALRLVGDTAFELGTIAGSVRPTGGEALHVVYDFTALWRRDADGVWRLASLVGVAAR